MRPTLEAAQVSQFLDQCSSALAVKPQGHCLAECSAPGLPAPTLPPAGAVSTFTPVV